VFIIVWHVIVVCLTMCFLVSDRRRALEVHKGGPSFLPAGGGSKEESCLSRLHNNGLYLVYNSVQTSTRKTYNVGVQAWFNFCSMVKCDPLLGHEPKGFSSVFGFKEDLILDFMGYYFLDRKFRPTTISTYLSAIKFMLKTSGVDISFLSAPVVSAARTGMCVLFRQNVLKSDDRTMPITVDFLVTAVSLFGLCGQPQRRVIVVAMVLAFTCLFRSCEYLGKFRVRGRDIFFEFRVIGSVNIFVSACDANLSKFSKNSLCGVLIHNEAAKNDPEGEGYRFHYPRQVISDDVAFDFVEILFDWAVGARLSPGDPFLSYRKQWCLSYSTFQKAIKVVAVHLGLDPNRYSTHSLRIGGATVMAAAGLPDYVIQLIGRWKSLAFLTYIRSNLAMFTSALSVLTNPKLFTVSHLMRANSGMRLPRRA
jgi:hypothetical protein